MAAPQPYRWDYDREAAEAVVRAGFDTFSVGVFQWLPKASGKGLKRSTAVRVLGYTAEPGRVFDRADELCRQLNEAGVRADAPPAWVQKQYAVPRPAGTAAARRSDDLTGAQVRSIRERVMRDELLPLGFVKGAGGTYARRRGEQVHLIDFQPSRWGRSFTVNLGFHYAFVPPIFQRRRLPLREFHLLDCALSARIGHFLPGGRDTWFDYGSDRAAIADVLVSCAAESLLVLDRQAAHWADPGVVLDALRSGNSTVWHDRGDDLTLGCVALRLGRLADARAAIERWFATSQLQGDAPVYQALVARLDEARAGLEPMDWVGP